MHSPPPAVLPSLLDLACAALAAAISASPQHPAPLIGPIPEPELAQRVFTLHERGQLAWEARQRAASAAQGAAADARTRLAVLQHELRVLQAFAHAFWWVPAPRCCTQACPVQARAAPAALAGGPDP